MELHQDFTQLGTRQHGKHQAKSEIPMHPHTNFWVAVNNNFLDMCVLDRCKLFAKQKGKHGWRQIVTDVLKLEADLLRHLGIDAATFENEIETMRVYRDKFAAHQDLEYTVMLPTLDIAKKAIWFYTCPYRRP